VNLRTEKTIALVLMFGAIASSVVCADPGGSVDVGVFSAYVWRGQVINDEAVVQPAFTLNSGGVSLNAWGNYNLTGAGTGPEDEFTEADLTASYAFFLGPVALTGGVLEYLFPHQELPADAGSVAYPGTRELFLTAGFSLPVISPSLGVYYDCDEVDSLYLSLSLAWGADVGAAFKAGLNAGLGYGAAGYNEFYFGVDEEAFNDMTFGGLLTWAPAASFALTAALQHSMLLDSCIEDAAQSLYKDDSQTTLSLKLTYTP